MAAESSKKLTRALLVLAVVAIAIVAMSLPAGRNLAGMYLFRSLRVQNVQAVNVDLSAFTDPNANPHPVHDMVAQMISQVRRGHRERKGISPPLPILLLPRQLAGFPVATAHRRARIRPKLVVGPAATP